jgi:hypothetical protein
MLMRYLEDVNEVRLGMRPREDTSLQSKARDHVPHIDIIVRSCDFKIILDFL